MITFEGSPMITRPSFLPLAAVSFIQRPAGSGLSLAALIGSLAVGACGGEQSTGPCQQQPAAPTVASVAVTPTTTTLILIGETRELWRGGMPNVYLTEVLP